MPSSFDKSDPVNHPSHYTAYVGLEIIDLTEQMNFNRGNAVKYIARAGLKDPETELQDLERPSGTSPERSSGSRRIRTTFQLLRKDISWINQKDSSEYSWT